MVTREQLKQYLEDAKEAHTEYENELGHSDKDWADWYSEYIIRRIAEQEQEEINS